ncbi:MAG TPA: hypothetical protein PLC90_10685 [Bacteroidales bacterium]|nr:hypothetical protein [Bacteroidales bacterium]HPI31627.1 hypothetical protein [Bacteroidales bacterium]HQN16809.1 hypothetical protein [Bacteroidales bacterium]
MKKNFIIIAILCLFAGSWLYAQEAPMADKQTLVDQFYKKMSFADFPEILKQFNEVTLPISSSAEQFSKASVVLKGKFSIDKNYVGLFVGNDISSVLFIYDTKGYFSDKLLVYDYWDDYYYDYYSVIEFALTKDLILDITCEGEDCEDYPVKYKIINGKFVRQ